MAALPPGNRNAARRTAGRRRGRGVATPLAMTVTWRRCTAGLGNWSWGTRWYGGGGGGSRKKTGRRSAASVEQGEDAAGRPSEAGVFTRLDDVLARHRAELFASTFRALPDYMVWYRDRRIKTEFGMSIMDRRRILGLVA